MNSTQSKNIVTLLTTITISISAAFSKGEQANPPKEARPILPIVGIDKLEITSNEVFYDSKTGIVRYSGDISITTEEAVIQSKGKNSWLEVHPDGTLHFGQHCQITKLNK